MVGFNVQAFSLDYPHRVVHWYLMVPEAITIYVLKDPRTNAVMYVGQTSNLHRRMFHHISSSGCNRTPKERWIYELTQANLRPVVQVLEIAKYEENGAAEAEWIRILNPPLNVGPSAHIERKDPERFKRWKTASLAAGVAAERERAEKKDKG